MFVKEVVKVVVVVEATSQPGTLVLAVGSHELIAGMLHTNLLSALHLLSSQVSFRFIFKTQFSVVLPFGSPLPQLVKEGVDPSCQTKVPSLAWSFNPIQ